MSISVNSNNTYMSSVEKKSKTGFSASVSVSVNIGVGKKPNTSSSAVQPTDRHSEDDLSCNCGKYTLIRNPQAGAGNSDNNLAVDERAKEDAFTQFKKEFDEFIADVDKRAAKLETLDDLRNSIGKVVKTADIAELMRKYDPEAFEKFKTQATFKKDGSWGYGGLAFLSRWQDKVIRGELKTAAVGASGGISENNETKLSAKAQSFLKSLRSKYGNCDFFAGNAGDDLKALANSGSKEFTVIFSNEELERMANDEKYAAQQLKTMEGAFKMSENINAQFGFESGGAKIGKIGMIFNEDGSTSFFAEMEKAGAKQRERLDKIREEKRAEKKEKEKKAQKADKEIRGYKKDDDTKRTTVEASSIEELLEKMHTVDWDKIEPEKIGGRVNYSI